MDIKDMVGRRMGTEMAGEAGEGGEVEGGIDSGDVEFKASSEIS